MSTKAKQMCHRQSLDHSLGTFLLSISKGCIYVCSSFHQTNFEDIVVQVAQLNTSTHSEL